MAETAYQRLTAAELLTAMKEAFGGSGPRGAARANIMQLAIVSGAKRVWYHAAWRWRCLPSTLTTTADQAYTTLPATYRSHRVIRHLWYSDAAELKCRFVEENMWSEILRRNAEANGTTTMRPTHCAVRLRTIDSSDVFVVEWSPTPNAVYTVYGLDILKAMPSIDFTASTNIFPEEEFDVLWQAAAFRSALANGLMLPGREGEYQKLMSAREFDDLMEQAADRWAIPDGDAVDTLVPDIDARLADFTSEEGNLTGQ